MGPSSSQDFRYSLTLWVWPTGLYPNRCIQYLKFKKLPPYILRKIRIIPEKLEQDGIYPINGLENRPAGCSLPCLVVRSDERPADDPHIVTQASAVLEFLEDLLPSSDGSASARGGDLFETGRARDAVNMWTEAIACAGFNVRHTHEWTLSWSGMNADEQSLGAANDALREMKKRIQWFETWRGQVLKNGSGRWLAGTASPTIADFTVVSGVAYMRRMYGLDALDGFPLMSAWMETYQKSGMYADTGDTGKLEKGESLDWALVASA